MYWEKKAKKKEKQYLKPWTQNFKHEEQLQDTGIFE